MLPIPLPAISMSKLSSLVLTRLLEITTWLSTGPEAQMFAKLLFTAVNALRKLSPVPSFNASPTLITCCGVVVMLNQYPIAYLPRNQFSLVWEN